MTISTKDTNGCTVTHIMVVYDNMNMFDMAVECGAAINIENNQGLSPLTTAAYLARSESTLDKYLTEICKYRRYNVALGWTCSSTLQALRETSTGSSAMSPARLTL